ncbi:hypothetical protein BDF19DRAFT_175293 [Syncephalis fuscata]|nr:hypothetical protein BDF19DRAFT_175293 [Syncephalis fuscata]
MSNKIDSAEDQHGFVEVQPAYVGNGSNVQFDLSGYEHETSSPVAPAFNYAPSHHTIDLNDQPQEIKAPTSSTPFFKNRRRMCLCICCLLILIILAILIPVVIFVVVPAIAQSSVNGSKMTITSVDIGSPREDSFTMKMAGTVTDTGPFDAQIELKDKVKMYYNDEELGQMTMDPINAKAGVGATIDAAPTFEVTNKDAFGRFSKVMMGEKSFTWVMKGTARVRAMGLLTIDNIKLEKELTFAGMQNFLNVKIKSFDLPSNHPLGGITMNVESSMENPSIFGMELGHLTFDIFYKDVQIVTANATGINLVPGVNGLEMKGRMIPQSRSEDLAVVGKMFSDYMNGRSSDMKVVGVSVRPTPDSKPISWLQAGFNGLTLNVKLDSKEDGRLIQSLDLGPLEMNFSPSTAWSPVTSAPNVVAGFKMPFGFPLEMKQVEQDITAYDNGVAMATMKVPMGKASGTSASGKIVTAIDNIPMNVIPSQHAQFSKFVSDLTLGSGKSMTMRGTVSSVASTAIGDVRIDGIKLNQKVTIEGLQGLTTAPVIVSNVQLVGGTPEALEIHMTCTMTNPSDLTLLVAAELALKISADNEDVGKAIIKTMQLKPGVNNIDAIFYFSPQTEAAHQVGRRILEGFISGTDFRAGIAGYDESTSIGSLLKGFSQLRFVSSVPSNHEPLARGGKYVLNLLSVALSSRTQAKITLYNPFDTAMVITTLKTPVICKGMTLGTVEAHFPGEGFVLAPKTTTESPVLQLVITISLGVLTSVLTAPNGLLIADIDGVINANVGGYPLELSYKQSGIRMERVGSL